MIATEQVQINMPKKRITQKTLVYKAFERFWHWTQALLIMFLIVTGFEIHGTYALMGYESAVVYHDVAAWALMLLIVFAIFWHFVTGAWVQYIPTMKLVKEQMNYYIFGIFRGAHHPTKKTSYNKFNPLQRLTYLGFKVFIIPLQIISGLIYMYYMYPDNPIQISGLSLTAILHTFGAFILVAFLIAHVYLLTTNEDPKESFVAMVTGWEELDIDPEEEHAKHMQYAVNESIAGYYRLAKDGTIMDVNEAWQNLYKCKDKNQIIGRSIKVTRTEDNAKQLLDTIDKVLGGESVRGIYSERKCFDGTTGKHILSMNPTYENKEITGVEGFIIDISDISNIQEQMYYSVRNSQAGYYRLDAKGYYQEVNDAWLRMYKCEEKDNIVGKHYSMSRNDDDLKQTDDLFIKVMKGETITSKIVTRRCKDGTSAKHILSANPVYDCDIIVGIEGFIIDISGISEDEI